MINFTSDYISGAHPEVMRMLNETNLDETPGYGEDVYSREAERLILKECGLPEGSVYFAVGGTQTNAIVVDQLLRRNEAVIAADTGHISIHEAGAIELSGHKVIELKGTSGKLLATDIDTYAESYHNDDSKAHRVRPAMVYISYPTELGTLYTLEELKAIHEVCRRKDMLLYIDGARLAYGLSSAGCDITMRQLAAICDVFYVGGTKCGTLFGEAIVTRRPELFRGFFPLMKMHGAVLAKGRLLGVQFCALFKSGLYFRIGDHAIKLAERIKSGFLSKGYRLYIDSPTNQQFVVISNQMIDKLKEKVSFETWGPRGENESVVRFVTSWSTRSEDVDELLKLI